MAGTKETAPRDGEDPPLPEGVGKADVVRNRCREKEVKGALRLSYTVPHGGKAVAEKVPLPPVALHVHLHPGEIRDHPLHQGRGIHETEDPVAEGKASHDLADAGDRRVNRDVADPLARKGEALGIGGGDEAVGIGGQDARDGQAVIDDLAVRLIGDEIDLRPNSAPFSVRSSASPPMSSRSYTFPVGLFGELIRMAFVFSVTASRTASRSREKSSRVGRSGLYHPRYRRRTGTQRRTAPG